MRKKLRSLLAGAGLREEEIALYLLLLKLGRASVSELTAKSKLNTMTAYRTVKRLRERGLLIAEPINEKEYIYLPLSLKALANKLSTEQRQLRKIELSLKNLDQFLPFAALDSAEEEQEPIAVYDGLEAFRHEYLLFPQICKHEYLHIGNISRYWQVAGMDIFSPDEVWFRQLRIKRGVAARIINTPGEVADTLSKLDSKEMRTTRSIAKNPIQTNYLAIAEDRVAHFLCDKQNPRTIVIQHPELVNIYKQQFTSLWNS